MKSESGSENIPRRVCSACGYDVRRLPEPRCPECGVAFAVESPRWVLVIPAMRQIAGASCLGVLWIVLRMAFSPRKGLHCRDSGPSFKGNTTRFLQGIVLCHFGLFLVVGCLVYLIEAMAGVPPLPFGRLLVLETVNLAFTFLRIGAAYGCPAIIVALGAGKFSVRHVLPDEWLGLAVVLLVGSVTAESVGQGAMVLSIVRLQNVSLLTLLEQQLHLWHYPAVQRLLAVGILHISSSGYLVFGFFVSYVLHLTLRCSVAKSIGILVLVSALSVAIGETLSWARIACFAL